MPVVDLGDSLDTGDPGRRPGVCSPWCDIADVPGLAYDADLVLVEQAILFASDVLYDLTGRRWPGECTATVRPCADRRVAALPEWWPGDQRGSWGTCTCNRAARCGCSSLSEVRLADRILEVLEVVVDGEVVPAVEYEVQDHAYLVGLTKADGSLRVWPCCQRMDLAPTEVGTWAVTLIHGSLPPVGGALAAASLASELVKALDPTLTGCRLPKRVTQITRQNISVAVLDPLTLFADGLTGLPEVDLWVQSTLLGSKRRRGRISVIGRGRRTSR